MSWFLLFLLVVWSIVVLWDFPFFVNSSQFYFSTFTLFLIFSLLPLSESHYILPHPLKPLALACYLPPTRSLSSSEIILVSIRVHTSFSLPTFSIARPQLKTFAIDTLGFLFHTFTLFFVRVCVFSSVWNFHLQTKFCSK